jgi:hypothetical protein
MANGNMAYNTYEAVVNAAVGVGMELARTRGRRESARNLIEIAIEKGLINILASVGSQYIPIGKSEGEHLDVEYILSAVLAGLYHSRNAMMAAGEQYSVSVISHLISSMSSTQGVDFFNRNVYGTTATSANAGTNP